ncbi:MAG TPA: PadR family transcriptional regulator [Alphaproteobacteria bacterium]|nr:PadR family transcriptional regulator [Alphaproteobacteria bacterium]
MFSSWRSGCHGRRYVRSSFGGHFGGHHRHGGLGGRLGRIFDHGDLRYVLLQLIREKPRHGYELIKAIEEKFGGMYSPSPGVIYPTLTLLEELGYVRPEPTGGMTSGSTKKLYAITDEGSAFLEANRPLVDSIFRRMAEIGEAYGGGPAPEILRAMQNLRAALAIRLRRGPLDLEQIRTIVSALDRVAGEIERS